MEQGLLDTNLRALVAEIAVELPVVYREKGKSNLSEMHHLQPATNRVVARCTPAWVPAPGLVGKSFGDKLGWVGLGLVDTVFHWQDETRTFLELKCGSDLSACAWDAVKLAAGVLNGNAANGYLLAAAPSTAWEKPTPGAEMFVSDRHTTDAIRDAHVKWWRAWQEEVVGGVSNRHIPGAVAAEFATIHLGSFPIEVSGLAWELRLARVDPTGSAWVIWKCV